MTNSYVYKWTHLPTMQWYVGSRTAKNAHPNDNYICSSKIVKPLILNFPNEWKKEVLFVGSPQEMRELESDILITLDARKDPRSFNLHNQGAKFVCHGHSDESKSKIAKSNPWLGKSRPDHAKKMTGRKRKPEDIKKWSDALKGVKKSSSHIKNLKLSKSLGVYITPAGNFASSRDAADANGCVKSSVLQKCFGYKSSRGKWYEPTAGWSFVAKETA